MGVYDNSFFFFYIRETAVTQTDIPASLMELVYNNT